VTDPTDTTIAGITVIIDEAAVRVASARPLSVLSSAFVAGGLGETRHILNMHVDDVHPDSSPEANLAAFAARLSITEPFVGLMTAAGTQHARMALESSEGATIAAVVSVGLSNTVCAGSSPPTPVVAGTINTILLVDARLTTAAMVNAIISATEAKTMALGEWQVRTPQGAPASGTSTDAVVVACTGRGEPLRYARPATVIGWLVARTVRRIGQICREKVERDGGRRVGW
jgi:iron complex transport system ATP-binding protein